MNQTQSGPEAIYTLAGTILGVDTSSREMVLAVAEGRAHLVVPPDCLIRLNGERVKLRLLQNGDHAEVAFSFLGTTGFAHSIQVNWLSRLTVASGEQKSPKDTALAPHGTTE